MRYFIGILWVLFVIFFHILIKYSIRLKLNSIILSKEKEKYENMRKGSRDTEEIMIEQEQKTDIEEDEELYAMNLENYIQNNQGKQILSENLEKGSSNKYGMKMMTKPDKKYIGGGSYLQAYNEVESNNYGVYKSLLS
jgi:hypothetical protein